MGTQAQYLFDDALISPARVVELVEADIPVVRLDRTIFHPATGSQRADRGTIAGRAVLRVEFNERDIEHFMEDLSGISLGSTVELSVDPEWRQLQSLYHSAGHLLVHATQRVRGDCQPLIGRHWPEQATVTFYSRQGLTSIELRHVQEEVQRLINSDLAMHAEPEGSIRWVRFGDLERMRCNGTHLRSTGLVGRITVVKHSFDGEHLSLHYVAYNA